MLIFQLGTFKLCCMCEFSFGNEVREKLLVFDICCIMFHSFCFHCDDSRGERTRDKLYICGQHNKKLLQLIGTYYYCSTLYNICNFHLNMVCIHL